MIDFHTHILPGIDDGSRDIDMTDAMLKEESLQGVDTIVATPHFYAHRVSVEDFLQRRAGSIEKVDQHLAGKNLPGGTGSVPSLRYGAEVYFFPGMGRAEKLPSLCISGTDTILIEMPFAQWTEEVLREIRDVLRRQKLQVVLAHVERYPEFQKDTRVWDQIMQLPLTIQLNAGSFLKGWSRKRFCMNMLKTHDRVILGSDCHNMDTRRPNLSDARALIRRKLGDGTLQRMDQAASGLLVREDETE